jgi:hypothetical protein
MYKQHFQHKSWSLQARIEVEKSAIDRHEFRRFSRQMRESIPKLREAIKEASVSVSLLFLPFVTNISLLFLPFVTNIQTSSCLISDRN